MAGDWHAVSGWFRPGRAPSFTIAPGGTPHRTAYLRVRHGDAIGFDVRLAPSEAAAQRRLREYLAVGGVLGGLLLFTCACVATPPTPASSQGTTGPTPR